MTLRISEAELVREIQTVLEKVKQGGEVIVEQEDHLPVAVISAPRGSGRPITQILADLERRNSDAVLDDEFGKDLNEIIEANSTPWHLPPWD